MIDGERLVHLTNRAGVSMSRMVTQFAFLGGQRVEMDGKKYSGVEAVRFDGEGWVYLNERKD